MHSISSFIFVAQISGGELKSEWSTQNLHYGNNILHPLKNALKGMF